MDKILEFITNLFPLTDNADGKGAAWLSPDGKFMWVNAHGDVDEEVMAQFPEVDMDKYLNGILLDKYNFVRLNNGGGPFGWDRYITLPKDITIDQIYAIEEWLENYDKDTIDIGTVDDVKTYSTDNLTYILNRLKNYKNTHELKEEVED